LHEFFRAAWFGNVGIRAQAVRLSYISFLARAAKHDGGDNRAFRVASQPSKKVKAIHALHFQIAQYHIRQRELLPIRILTLSSQIMNRFLAVADGINCVTRAAPFGGPLNKNYVVILVLNQENAQSTTSHYQ